MPFMEVEAELAARAEARMAVIQEEQRQRDACAQRRADLGSLIRSHELFACSRQPADEALIQVLCSTCCHPDHQHVPRGGYCLGCLAEITALKALDVDP